MSLSRSLLAGLTLGSLLSAVAPGVAHAHADVVRTWPRNGSVVAVAPDVVTVTFSEPVSLDSARLLGADGHDRASTATVSGTRLTIIPRTSLAGERTITAAWKVSSEDGHQVSGASAFMVGRPSEAGPSVALVTTPSIATSLRGGNPGRASVVFGSTATSGEVQWTTSALPEPLTWNITGRKRSATGTGVLPFAGSWSMRATLVSGNGAVMVVLARVEVVP